MASAQQLWRLLATELSALIERGLAITAAQHIDAFDVLAAFRVRLTKAFEKTDLLLTPTSTALAWPIGKTYPKDIDGQQAGPRDAAIFQRSSTRQDYLQLAHRHVMLFVVCRSVSNWSGAMTLTIPCLQLLARLKKPSPGQCTDLMLLYRRAKPANV